MKINKEDMVIYCKQDQRVREDLAPLIQGLMDCFVCIHETNEHQYRNNLIMLRYYLKAFEEVCKE